jgi:dienelactone hydrolase
MTDNPAGFVEQPRVAVFLLLLSLSACGGGGGVGGGLPASTGTLTVSGCTITENQSSCQATVIWTSTNAASPSVASGGVTLSTQPSGSVALPVGVASITVALTDSSRVLDQEIVQGACVAATGWDGTACRRFATRSVMRAPTPFVEGGQAVELEVVLYTPPGTGPFPTVMFNHGSTGNGSDPSQFTVTFQSESVARFFAERGWQTAFPQRRGRGTSGGLYDEGFTPDRSGYSCDQAIALSGASRALADLDAAVDFLRGRVEVDTTRMLAAGTSRGGILAIAHTARRPDVYLGAINFVGGWLGEGCGDFAIVNRTLFQQGASFSGPSIWIYATNDSFYSLPHSQSNFTAYTNAGGMGTFRTYTRAAGLNGHFVHNDSALWSADLGAWIDQLLRLA